MQGQPIKVASLPTTGCLDHYLTIYPELSWHPLLNGHLQAENATPFQLAFSMLIKFKGSESKRVWKRRKEMRGVLFWTYAAQLSLAFRP